jgi:nucleotide-binding universal stress UspA family protein
MEHHELTEYEMLQNAGRAMVSKSETRVGESGLNQIESLVEVRDAAERIVNMAGVRRVDVIVLGRRGRGTIAQLLLVACHTK